MGFAKDARGVSGPSAGNLLGDPDKARVGEGGVMDCAATGFLCGDDCLEVPVPFPPLCGFSVSLGSTEYFAGLGSLPLSP
jgi:hypothetical protein